MPAYATVEFVLLRDDLRRRLVADFYEALQVGSVHFDRAYPWGCPDDMPYEEIVAWNQRKLEANFRLGDEEHVSQDYRQILLGGTPFSECRVFILSRNHTICFDLIVPEGEVRRIGWEQLKDVSGPVWHSLPIQAIQTYGELGESAPLAALLRGEEPSVLGFAFIPTKDFVAKLRERYSVTALEKGCLVENI